MARLLSYKQASAAAGDLSESSIRRLVEDGKLPEPVVLSKRKDGHPARIAFVEEEFLAALDKLIAKARGAVPEAAA